MVLWQRYGQGDVFGVAEAALAACAVVNGPALWTLHPRDFSDVPGLTLA